MQRKLNTRLAILTCVGVATFGVAYTQITISGKTTLGGVVALSTNAANAPGLVRVVSQSLLPDNTDCNGSQCLVSAGGTFLLRLPDVTAAGNAIVLGVTMKPSGGGCTTVAGDITDDAPGGSNTWTAGPSGSNSTNNQFAFIFYALNVKAGTRLITISVGHCGTNYSRAIQATAIEVYNIATASAADGSSCNSGNAGTAVTTGSFTPGTSGDFIFAHVLRTNAQPNVAASWAAGSGFTLSSADRLDGSATEYGVQSVAGAINPAFTMGDAANWVSCGLALKAGVSGSGIPSSGITVIGIYHETFVKGSATTQTLQIPCRGNLLVAAESAHITWVLNSITDTNSNTWNNTGAQINSGSGGNGVQTFYVSPSLTCSSDMVLTVTWSNTASGHSNIMFYDIANAKTSSTALDIDGGTSGNSNLYTTSSAPSITPSAANELVIAQQPVAYNTMGSCTGITLFDASSYSGMNQSGPEPVDQNNGWCHGYTVDTAQINIGWQGLFTSHVIAEWSARASIWKPAP